MSCNDVYAKYMDGEERDGCGMEKLKVSWKKWTLNQSLKKEGDDIKIDEREDSKERKYLKQGDWSAVRWIVEGKNWWLE